MTLDTLEEQSVLLTTEPSLQSMLACLEISSAKQTSPLSLNGTLFGVSEYGENEDRFLGKISG